MALARTTDAPPASGIATTDATHWGMPTEGRELQILPGKEAFVSMCRAGDAAQLVAFVEQPRDDDEEPPELSAALDNENNTGLHMAAFFGHVALVKELIQRSAQVDAREARQRTPLHIACKEGYEQVVLELILAKADANAADYCGETPAHKASIPLDLEVLKVVHEHGGADLGVPDHAGMTPLLHAARVGNLEFVKYLLEKDASLIDAENQARWTALHLAAHGIDFKVSQLKPPKYADTVKLLLESKAELDRTNEDLKTALHLASAIGNCLTASALIDAGANLDFADNCRWRPIHYACQSGHEKMLALLLQRKAVAEVESPQCLTPLAVVTMENLPKLAEMLVKHKADPNMRGPGLASPMMIARKEKEKYADILSLFELGFIGYKK